MTLALGRAVAGDCSAVRRMRPATRLPSRRASDTIGSMVRAVFRVVLGLQLVVWSTVVLVPVGLVVGLLLALDVGAVATMVRAPERLAPFLVLVVVAFVAYVVHDALLERLALRGEYVGVGPLARFIEATYNFSLGAPTGVHSDRDVLERIHAQGGVLRAEDLVEWQGIPLGAARTRISYGLARQYGGERCEDPAIFEYRFPEIDRLVATPRPAVSPRTGNTPRDDARVWTVALANAAVGVAVLALVPSISWPLVVVRHAFGVLPVVCSTVVLGLGVLRGERSFRTPSRGLVQ